MDLHTELEYRWARWNDLDPRGMVICSSGTAALHLAFEGLDLPQGSKVVMSDYNMIACPRAVVMAGLKPVFVDCDRRLTICPDGTHRVLKDLPHEEKAAVLAVHVYGRSGEIPNLHNLYTILENGNVKVVEDLAEAHGVRPSPNSDAACWSFYRNKIVAGEEGGAVWFRNPLRAKAARRMRSLGFKDENDYTHTARGHNYRLANSLASKILASLNNYHENLTRRREAEAWYDEACPPEWRQPPRDAPWVYDLRIPGLFRGDQERIVKKLRDAGVEARCGFKPMTWQEEFKDQAAPYESPPNKAAKAAHEVFYLPLTPGTVTRESVRACFETIRAALGSRG